MLNEVTQKRIDSLEREKQQKIEYINSIDSQISSLNSNKARLTNEFAEYEKEYKSLMAKYNNRDGCGFLKQSCNDKYKEPANVAKSKMDAIANQIVSVDKAIEELKKQRQVVSSDIDRINKTIAEAMGQDPAVLVEEQKKIVNESEKIAQQNEGKNKVIVIAVVAFAILAIFLLKK